MQFKRDDFLVEDRLQAVSEEPAGVSGLQAGKRFGCSCLEVIFVYNFEFLFSDFSVFQTNQCCCICGNAV